MLKKLLTITLIGAISLLLFACSSNSAESNKDSTLNSKVVKLDNIHSRASITNISVIDTTIYFTLNNLVKNSTLTAGEFEYVFKDDNNKTVVIPLGCEGMEIFSGSKFDFTFNTLKPLKTDGFMRIRSLTYENSAYNVNN